MYCVLLFVLLLFYYYYYYYYDYEHHCYYQFGPVDGCAAEDRGGVEKGQLVAQGVRHVWGFVYDARLAKRL